MSALGALSLRKDLMDKVVPPNQGFDGDEYAGKCLALRSHISNLLPDHVDKALHLMIIITFPLIFMYS